MIFTNIKSHGLSQEELNQRTIDFIDIVNDPLAEHKYKENEGINKLTKKNFINIWLF